MIPATLDRDRLLATAYRSPELVGRHDKAGWLALYARRHVVEDPVGAHPVRSEDAGALGRFWDAFIAPNDIVFEPHHDWIADGQVVRDVTIRTTLPAGVTVRTRAHLLYEIVEEDGELRIARMAAHWEPAPVFAQLLRPGRAHLHGLATMSQRMLRHLGPVGTLRFAGAVRSLGAAGKQAVRDELGDRLEEPTTVIAAGDTVTATGTVDGIPAAVIARLDRRTRRVVDLRIYT